MGRKPQDKFSSVGIEESFKEFSRLLSFVPHEKQLEFLRLPNRIRCFIGGNRSGKSYVAIYDLIFAALGIHPFQDYPPPPLRLRVVGPSFDAVINTIHLPKFREILPEGSYVWYAERRVLELFNGSTIQFMSYDQELLKFAGGSFHAIWMDEEPPEKIFNENLMRIVDTKGKILLTFTPVSGISWLYHFLMNEAIDERGIPLVGTVFCSTYENPYISKDEIENIKRLCRDAEEIAARIEGKFFSRSGLILKEFDRRRHVVEGFSIPEDWSIFIGIDHHIRNPQAVVFVAVDPDDNLWVFDEFYEVALIPEVCAAIHSKLSGRKIALAIIDTNAATPDSVTGRSARNEYWRHGIYVVSAKKGKNSLLEGLAILREYLSNDRIKIFSNCKNLIKQIENYRWDEWSYRKKDKRDPKEVPLKKEDHLIDALRYVVHMRPAWRPSVFYRTRRPKQEPLFRKTGY